MKDDANARLLNPQQLLEKQLELKFGHQVADLGCGGAGYFTLPAARLVGSRGKVYAVDILKTALEGVLSKAIARVFGVIFNHQLIPADLS